MKLESFRIKNIKSIIDSDVCHLSSDNITILAGQNEAGKSAVLEALKFFTKGKDDKFNRYSIRNENSTPSIPYVECKFKMEESDTQYDDDNITRVLKEVPNIQCYREGDNNISFLEDTKLLIISVISQLLSHNEINIINQSENENATEEEKDANLKIAITKFGEKIESTVLKDIPKFDYYDSFENILPETINIQNIPNNEAVKDFQTAFDINLAEYINLPVREKNQKKQAVERNLIVDFNDYWTQRLTGEDNSKYKFIISDDAGVISFLIDREHNNPLFIIQKSKGFQWFVAFYLRLKALSKDEDNFNNYILLIDEPGQGLHEAAQTDVKKVLNELAKAGMQIIYTTHHPHLIDVEDTITRLRLVYHDINNGTKIKTLPQMASLPGQQSLDTLSPIRTAMGLINLSCIDLSKNKNVIVEGITDKYYIEAFSKILNTPLEYNIIPSCGCENIKNIASILLGWGYKFKVIIDGGEGKTPKEDTTEKVIKEKLLAYDDEIALNTIKRLSKVAIEDLLSKKDFREFVKPKAIPSKNKNNVALAKESGKKELWARLFAENVNTNQVKATDLDEDTKNNFNNLISWIQAN